jgi:hypothetical protein
VKATAPKISNVRDVNSIMRSFGRRQKMVAATTAYTVAKATSVVTAYAA